MYQAAFMYRPDLTDAEFAAFTAPINACANRLDGFPGGATVRQHWTDKPCLLHISDGPAPFVVLDGAVDMHARSDGEATYPPRKRRCVSPSGR